MTELDALVERTVEAGLTPWCMGIESQSATGWPATDWVEDLIVRQQGSEVYRDWVAGTVPFDDERIAAAFATLRELVLQPERVAGGVGAVVGRTRRRAMTRCFPTLPDACCSSRRASPTGGCLTDSSWDPTATSPSSCSRASKPERRQPIVAGVDLAISFTNRPEVDAVLPDWPRPRQGFPGRRAGATSASATTSIRGPTTGVPTERWPSYWPTPTPWSSTDPTTCPHAVGTTLFWSEITAWIAGRRTYDRAARRPSTRREPAEPPPGRRVRSR